MLPFRPITLEDRARVIECAAKYNYRLCDHCFVDLFMWAGRYDTQICFFGGFLLVKTHPEEAAHERYLAPIGEGDLTAALDALLDDAAERGNPPVLLAVDEQMCARIEAAKPDTFAFLHETEDGDDYIYLAEKLSTLSGKKLQSKRNLVNRFKAAYEGRWHYRAMTAADTEQVYQFHISWCKCNGCSKNKDLVEETCAIVVALKNFEALGLEGGLLYLDDKLIAFTLGCRSTPDQYTMQIEKADHEIAGAYQMINQQFVLSHLDGITYFNREEDLGLEGLRRAKHSYYPALRGVKYTAVLKEGRL